LPNSVCLVFQIATWLSLIIGPRSLADVTVSSFQSAA
jgi:hypothetical protein